MDIVETFPAAISFITNKKHLPNYLTCDATAGPSNTNEHREANYEEGVGESENDGDDALDLEEVFANALLERESEVDGTNIVGEESGRLQPRTPIYWTPPHVKINLGELKFETVDNPGQWSEFTFIPVFTKRDGIYKRHALPTGVMPPPHENSGTRLINRWDFHYNDW